MQETTAARDSHAAFDIVVIGAGPGGYEAALHAARRGRSVCLVEKGPLGGTCVNWGCIPTKALLRSAEVFELARHPESFGVNVSGVSFDLSQAVKRSRQVALKSSKAVDFMLRKAGVTVLHGEATLVGGTQVEVTAPGGERQSLDAGSVILATGARPRSIPGLEPDGDRVITSREALVMKALPSSLIVAGGGAIGVEMAWFFAKAGVKVTLVEMMPAILPLEDAEISGVLRRSFEKSGIRVLCGARIAAVQREPGSVTADILLDGKEGEPERVQADFLLVAVGVTGAVEGIGLERAGVETARGFVVTDGACRTSAPGIWAIGDVRGGMLLAHKASAEAAIAVESIVGNAPEPLVEELVPRCVYAQPSVASVGLTEAAAASRGIEVRVGRAQFAASGKANAYGQLEGLVKLIFSADARLLGAHLVGHDAVELIGELGLACRMGVTAGDILRTVHAHPTLSESVRDAAFAAFPEGC